ncbi:MAG TPA: ankyrin repeat domain-containing protein [Thermoanaerobaculia bacterium]|jgi:hypothetical protein|nr:ankyrin repeat domain-containing protein [Thermoanaerobaculia bacterium]
MKSIAAAILFLIGWAVRQAEPTMIEAVRTGDVTAIRTLAARGADVNAPSGRNGWTPLHAIHRGQVASATALLDAGADPNRASANGTTPLMMAAGYGDRDAALLLLRGHADAARRDRGGAAAIDYALFGMNDLDAFTLFSCQDATASLLARVSPRPKTSALRWARMKRCDVPLAFSRS